MNKVEKIFDMKKKKKERKKFENKKERKNVYNFFKTKTTK